MADTDLPAADAPAIDTPVSGTVFVRGPWLLLAFIGLLLLPLLQMATGWIPTTPLDEKRALAPAPTWTSWRDGHAYLRGGARWMDDHFGLREVLVRGKTQVDFSFFGMTDRVFVGADGWLFYRHVMLKEKPDAEQRLARHSDAVVAGVRALQQRLAARGVTLAIVIAPMKDVLYGDKLPPEVPRIPEPRQAALLEQKLRGIDGLVVVEATDILRGLATQRTVFHRTDFHWNDPAAFEVARVLVDRLGARAGRTGPVWTHPLVIDEQRYSGGEAAFMPIFFPPTERGLVVHQNWDWPPFDFITDRPPYLWLQHTREPTPAQLPPVVLLGDSFSDGLTRSGFAIHFRDTYRMEWGEGRIRQLEESLPPDCRFVVVEFIEISGTAVSELMAARER
jgi:hypothetical protein